MHTAYFYYINFIYIYKDIIVGILVNIFKLIQYQPPT